ncbi:MAG: fibronectin type III domain-containing protein, partial [Candidatus Heimdallarchaeota archaeon]|nr:fibronectin type III domain-containing protein [Candidatus Heimdallarchaeota archaeon]
MNILNFIVKHLILFVLFVGCTTQKEKYEYSNFSPTGYPDRIMLTIPGDPATSRAVTWRTVYEDTASIGEITLMDAAPTLEQNKVTVTGIFAPWEEGSQTAMGHKVIFENLKPDTKYAYRVGDNENWSEWFQFKTSSDKAEPFSFLYFGDVQNDIKPYGSRVLRQAYSHFSNADFM